MSGGAGTLLDYAREGRLVLTFRKCALLCVILAAHLVLVRLLSLRDGPREVKTSEAAAATLFFVDSPDPRDTPLSTRPGSERAISIGEAFLASQVAPDSMITLPSEIDEAGAVIDWDAEASRVASDAVRRMDDEKKYRALDQHPAGMGPPPPKSSRHQLGDSQRFEGGVIIDWINDRCYYSNQDAPIAAFGPALRLQLPTCKAAGGDSLPSFEAWKKERDSR